MDKTIFQEIISNFEPFNTGGYGPFAHVIFVVLNYCPVHRAKWATSFPGTFPWNEVATWWEEGWYSWGKHRRHK